MKKIMFSAFLAGSFFMVNATEEVVPSHEGAPVVEQHSAYEGAYFGLGISAIDDGFRSDYTANNRAKEGEINDRRTHLNGALIAGFGKKIRGQAYVGIEAGLDFGPKAEYNAYDKASVIQGGNRYYDVNLSRNGLIPSLAFRVGFVDCNTKILSYVKFGGAYTKAKYYYQEKLLATGQVFDTTEIKKSSIRPIIALGFEKPFGKTMTARAEAEWRFGKKTSSTDHLGTTEFRTKDGGLTVRVLVSHNIKIGA
ncbi:MAG: hypothetical protein LBO02_03410 [Holosporaceae bacterium]|nr:hypothetical protein [Holosporaceae bacterium]